ncbi:MAG: TSUP family transporter, partial [Mailhella sp.]|nr:TSUP family transporter [Mailhella sp.]
MEYSAVTVITLMAAFFTAGFVDSIAGGGGLISTPSLLVCGVPPHVALGTGKFASVMGSLTSLWAYARRGPAARRIAP